MFKREFLLEKIGADTAKNWTKVSKHVDKFWQALKKKKCTARSSVSTRASSSRRRMERYTRFSSAVMVAAAMHHLSSCSTWFGAGASTQTSRGERVRSVLLGFLWQALATRRVSSSAYLPSYTFSFQFVQDKIWMVHVILLPVV